MANFRQPTLKVGLRKPIYRRKNPVRTAVEPTLDYVVTGTASTGPNIVSTGSPSSGVWYGAIKSDSGANACFYIKDDVSSGTTYATGTTCTATAAASATFGSKW